MSLNQGRQTLSIPGPSIMPDRVLRAMHRAAPNIYEGELIDLTARILTDLKRVARTDGTVAVYICNGHGAWEASLSNTLNRGDKVLALSTGRFTKGWIDMARALGADVQELDFGPRAPIDPDQVEAALKADPSIKAVLCVHTDTASSVRNDIPSVRAAIDAAKHDALLMVDCIASLACDRFEMDAWGVDVMVTGCQKGLMTPPGLGMTFQNDRALARRREVEHTSVYWDWLPRIEPEIYYQHFCGTAPTHHLYGLGEALTMLLEEEGIENVWARHDRLASSVWAAVETWGDKGGALACNIAERGLRSSAVTTIRTGTHPASALRAYVEKELGVTLGVGLGLHGPHEQPTDDIFRIGHMGHLNPHMLLGTLACVEAGLKALQIPHNSGGIEAAHAALV